MRYLLIAILLVGCATQSIPPEQARAIAKHKADAAECKGSKECMRAKGYVVE